MSEFFAVFPFALCGSFAQWQESSDPAPSDRARAREEYCIVYRIGRDESKLQVPRSTLVLISGRSGRFGEPDITHS